MKTNPRLLVWLAGAVGASLAATFLVTAAARESAAPAVEQRPDLAYLKQVNQWGPPDDPQLVLLLMGQFANAGRHAEGAVYLDGLRRRFDARLGDGQRAIYLSAIASLRAGHANDVPLLKRYGWVRDTVRQLDEAKRLTHDEGFVPRWMSGVVRAQLPGFFGERDAALADLTWCLNHADRAPHAGWLREVHFQLAAIQARLGNAAEAQRHQLASGFPAGDTSVHFTTPFSVDAASGLRFSGRTVREAVPGSVYVLSGFDFTEFYFIVSADRRELIAIDAGTSAVAARQAFAALRARVPQLPPLTTVFVTHAHWDHVGGHAYLRSLNPAVRFVGRENNAEELALGAGAHEPTLMHFFGRDFRLADVLTYKPDVAIDHPVEMVIGGTLFSLRPTPGGETRDALLVHMPDQGLLFTGDVFMPYFGAPFAEEGSVEGLLASIDQVTALAPRLLLQGHEPLTRIFGSTRTLAELRAPLAWLRERILRGIARGEPRAALQQANLVAPALEHSASPVHLAYLLLRENLIDRLFDQHSGYWQNGLQGLDTLSDADHGAALLDYLEVDESRLVSAARRMAADGRHELAAATLRAALARRPASERLRDASREAHTRLMEQYQEFSPFKLILYGVQAERPLIQQSAPAQRDEIPPPVFTTGQTPPAGPVTLRR
jgi:glyoxylase-like metal-dependent hydrolase (beta-lactamase superfamily II)